MTCIDLRTFVKLNGHHYHRENSTAGLVLISSKLLLSHHHIFCPINVHPSSPISAQRLPRHRLTFVCAIGSIGCKAFCGKNIHHETKDKEQEDIQSLGLFGIYEESCNIILRWKKLFAQITLALILPLSFIFLLHMKVSDALFSDIVCDLMSLDGENYDKLSDRLNKETVVFLLFQAVYFAFLLTFSLLATSAVVYTVASVYAGQEVSFKTVMRVVPKVWKKLMAILFLMFCLIFLYDILAIVLFFAYQSIISSKNVGMTFYVVFGGFYLVGLVYISTVWQLAGVVAVLEEASYTGHAISKSHTLIKGKLWVVSLICLKFNLLLGLIQLGSQNLVVHGNNTVSTGIASRIAFGVVCCSLLCALILFELVVQTVVYVVCKSYHHEKIDKSALSDHLEGYLGEYVPLVSKDVQLEHYNV